MFPFRTVLVRWIFRIIAGAAFQLAAILAGSRAPGLIVLHVNQLLPEASVRPGDEPERRWRSSVIRSATTAPSIRACMSSTAGWWKAVRPTRSSGWRRPRRRPDRHGHARQDRSGPAAVRQRGRGSHAQGALPRGDGPGAARCAFGGRAGDGGSGRPAMAGVLVEIS